MAPKKKRPAPAYDPSPPAVSSDKASSESGRSEEEEKEDESSSSSDEAAQNAPKPSSASPLHADAHSQKPDPSSEAESGETKRNSRANPKRRKSNADSRSQSSRKTAPLEEKSSKMPLIQRFWSEEDEITLLEGMIEYREKKGINPSTNINSFHGFIKERLGIDVVPGQLVNKIRCCRQKFKNNVARVAKKGNERVFAGSNDRKIFELSEQLWGSEEEKGITGASTVLESLCYAELSRFSNGRVDGNLLRRGLGMIADSKRKELGKKWQKLKLAELQVLSDRALLISELTSSIMNAYQKF